jgi:hypothetical protein
LVEQLSHDICTDQSFSSYATNILSRCNLDMRDYGIASLITWFFDKAGYQFSTPSFGAEFSGLHASPFPIARL